MKIENGRVKISNKYIVEFLSTHSGNDVIINACESMFENICRSMNECMNQYNKEESNKREVSGLISFLQEFEKRQLEMNDKIEEKFGKVADKMVEKVSLQLTTMMFNIDNIIKSSVEKLNVDRISDIINTNMKHNLSDGYETMYKRIENQLNREIREPFVRNQEMIISQLNVLPTQMKNEDEMKNVNKNLNKWIDNYHLMIENIRQMDTKMSNMPHMTKSVTMELIKDLEKSSRNIEVILNSTQQQLSQLHVETKDNVSSLAVVMHNMNEVKTKVETLDKQILSRNIRDETNCRNIGMEGENRIFNLLTGALNVRDEYECEQVNGQAMNTDIVVRRKDYPTIRIEVKSHGKESGEKVRTKEIEKLKRDVIECNNHAIMVSIYSDIVGRSNYQIEQMANGKFIIYLAKNNYDIDSIVSMIYLLYKLDNMTNVERNNENVKITTENLKLVKQYVQESIGKIKSIKMHLTESISLLNDMTLENIEKILLNNEKDSMTKNDEPKEILVCGKCNKEFTSKGGFATHVKRCTKESITSV